MLFCDIGLEQQLGIGGLLVHTVLFVAVVGIHLVNRGITHQGDVRPVFWIEDESVLHIPLIAVSLYSNFIKR